MPERTIKVEQAHIDAGIARPPKGAARDDSRDPVSLALRDALPEGSEFVGVEPRPTDPTPLRSLLYIEDGDTGDVTEYDMPESVWAWLRRFDKGDRVEPFEIVLTETEDE